MRRSLTPSRVYVQVTDRCLAGCAHCGFDCRPTFGGRISPEAVEAFLDDFALHFGQPTHLALTGGEPMLEPALTCRLARLATDRGIVVRLVTNAAFAETPDLARQAIDALVSAGVAGLWVSAGVFHDRVIPRACTRNLLAATGRIGLPVYLNFTYLRPLASGTRGKGLVGVDARIGADRQTARLHEDWARHLPERTHGWARIWDTGRARALIDELDPGIAATLRRELREAEAQWNGLEDLIGFGLDGRVFAGEHRVDRSGASLPGGLLSALR